MILPKYPSSFFLANSAEFHRLLSQAVSKVPSTLSSFFFHQISSMNIHDSKFNVSPAFHPLDTSFAILLHDPMVCETFLEIHCFNYFKCLFFALPQLHQRNNPAYLAAHEQHIPAAVVLYLHILLAYITLVDSTSSQNPYKIQLLTGFLTMYSTWLFHFRRLLKITPKIVYCKS